MKPRPISKSAATLLEIIIDESCVEDVVDYLVRFASWQVDRAAANGYTNSVEQWDAAYGVLKRARDELDSLSLIAD